MRQGGQLVGQDTTVRKSLEGTGVKERKYLISFTKEEAFPSCVYVVKINLALRF